MTTYCRRWINTKKSTVPKCLSLRGGTIWHFASKTSCGALHCCELFLFYFIYLFIFCYLWFYSRYISGFVNLQRFCRDVVSVSLRTEQLQKKPKKNLLLIFPTDLPVRAVVPNTQCFGTVTMLAQTQVEHPHPIFPGPWEFNTLPTKSHFPFLWNFHTPAQTPLPLRYHPPMAAGMAAWKLNNFFHHLLFPSLPRVSEH